MPKIGLYVSEADKAFLDQLPDGVGGSAILRDAIRRARRGGAECAHEHQRVTCLECGAELDRYHHPIETSAQPEAPAVDETPGQG